MAHHERTLVFDRKDFTETGEFYVTPDDTGIRVPGPGSLDTLLVVATEADLGVRVETDSTVLVDEEFSRLKEFSDELEHVSAYDMPSGDKVISVTDFEYLDYCRAMVDPKGEKTFDWVRAVYTIED